MSRSLPAILALALVLRLLGLTWGLPGGVQPEGFHPDEAYDLQVVTTIDPWSGDFNPDGSHIEGALNYYLWWLIEVPTLTVASEFRPMTKAEAKALALFTGRLMSVAFDLISIALIYHVGRRLSGEAGVGAVAALLLAVAPGEVIISHYMRAHILTNTWLILTLMLTLRLARGELGPRGIVLFGIVIGLLTATRYSMAMTGMFLWLPWILTPGRGARVGSTPAVTGRWPMWVWLAVATLASLVAFFVGDPFLWLDWQGSQIYIQQQRTHFNADKFIGMRLLELDELKAWLGVLLPHAFTWPVAIAVYIAFLHQAVTAWRRPDRAFLVSTATFALIYLYFMAKGYAVPEFVRATLPLVPIGCLFLALSWKTLLDRLLPQGRKIAWGIGTILLVAFPIRYSLAFDLAMYREDSRLEAREWIEANIARSEIIGLASKPWFYTPPLGRDRGWSVVSDIEGLRASSLRYWIVSDYEMTPEMAGRIEEETPYRRLISFTRGQAPLGVRLKEEGAPLPLDFLYPCLDIWIFERRSP